MTPATVVVLFVLFVASVFAAPVSNAQPTSASPRGKQADLLPERAQGELLWVDLDAKAFAIQTMDGGELQFRFSDETEINGFRFLTAGLAAFTGTQVRVDYSFEDDVAVAMKIELQRQRRS